jgi:hypothetical protein
MTFDEQLRRAFETLTAHLHDELSRQAQNAIDELAASAQAERDQLMASARSERDQLVASAQSERDQLVASAQAERDQAVAEAREQQRNESPTPELVVTGAPDSAGAERLVDAIRAIDDAHTLSEILDALVRGAAREVDRVAVLLVRGGGYSGWRSIGFHPPFDRGQSVELPPDALIIPLEIGSQTVAVLYFQSTEPAAANPEPGTPNPEPGTENPALEILARHAARCLESVTAFKAARAALANAGDSASDTSDEASADENAAARRYAKLLVSEIKLYHEPDVVAGRRARDLAARLGGEITRARVLYEQRVPPHVRHHTDYFHDELVRTLANGDPGLLELRT